MRDMFSRQAESTAKWAGVVMLCLAAAGCGGGGGDDGGGNGGGSPQQGNTVGVSPAQVDYDAAAGSFDNVATPSTPDGSTVLSAAEIAAAQAEIDRIGDRLLAL